MADSREKEILTLREEIETRLHRQEKQLLQGKNDEIEAWKVI